MSLEQQLAKLSELGIHLEEDISIDDLLRWYDQESFEKQPFHLILFVLGTDLEDEPGGRSCCPRVWDFDLECITSTGDYTQIVKRLCRVADQPTRLTDISDFVDLEAGEAWLKYKVDGTERNWSVEVSDDWADPSTIELVMSDIERDGHRFYSLDNGQAMVLFYLDSQQAAELNRLAKNALKPVLAKSP